MMLHVQYEGVVEKITTPINICDSLSISCFEYEALWDTGAVRTVISLKVVSDLKLTSVGNATMRLGNDSNHPCKLYDIRLMDNETKKPTPLTVAATTLPDVDAIIGMDFITKGEFICKKINGDTHFSFTL